MSIRTAEYLGIIDQSAFPDTQSFDQLEVTRLGELLANQREMFYQSALNLPRELFNAFIGKDKCLYVQGREPTAAQGSSREHGERGNQPAFSMCKEHLTNQCC